MPVFAGNAHALRVHAEVSALDTKVEALKTEVNDKVDALKAEVGALSGKLDTLISMMERQAEPLW